MAQKPYNETALFNLFISREDHRPKLQKPVTQGRYVCATDTRIAIRLPKCSVISCDAYETVKTPDFSRVFPQSAPAFTLSRAQLVEAIMKCRIEVTPWVRCSDCNGSGMVLWKYQDCNGRCHTDIYNCPVCDDRCMVENGLGIFVGIGSRVFVAHYIIRIIKAMEILGANTLKVTAPVNRAWMFEPCEGVEIILMPSLDKDSTPLYIIIPQL